MFPIAYLWLNIPLIIKITKPNEISFTVVKHVDVVFKFFGYKFYVVAQQTHKNNVMSGLDFEAS